MPESRHPLSLDDYEPLKHAFHGYWPRRITDEHRLIYTMTEGALRLAACRYDYE